MNYISTRRNTLTSPFSNGTIFETDVSQITESSEEMGLMLSLPKYDSQSLIIKTILKNLKIML